MDFLGIKKTVEKTVEKTVKTVIQEFSTKAVSDRPLPLQFNTQIFPHWSAMKDEAIYQTVSDIYSVVSRLSQQAALLPYYGELDDGEDVTPKDKINSLIDQLTFDLLEQIFISYYLNGSVFIYKEKLDFGVNACIKNLIPLSPANMEIVVSKGFPTQIVEFQYIDNEQGITVRIPPEDIIYFRRFNAASGFYEKFQGLSLATILKREVTRIKAGGDASIAQMQNGGVPSIVFDKSPGRETGVANQHKENFSRFLNNPSNTGAPYFTGGEMGVIQLGTSLADLSIAELNNIDFDKICNALGVSSIMFNSKHASTESNVKEMRKAMFTNAIIPVVRKLESALNTQAVPDTKSQAKLKADYSDVPELQEDMKLKADAYAAMPVIRPNDVLEGMGYKREQDENMEKFYMKSGYVLIDDMTAPPDLQNTSNDYANNTRNSGQGNPGNGANNNQ